MTASDSQPSASEAVQRLSAYLDEMDRVDAASSNLRYADEVHGINDLPLRRSDIRAVIEQASREVTEAAKYKALAKDHFEEAERSFDHVQVLRDRIARIREWVGEHQEHEVYEADSMNPAECSDECTWCPVVDILEEPEQWAGRASHECRFDITPEEERPTLVSADDAPDGPECIFCHRMNDRQASREVTEAETKAAAREFERVWNDNLDGFDPEQHDEEAYIEAAMHAALVAAREVRS